MPTPAPAARRGRPRGRLRRLAEAPRRPRPGFAVPPAARGAAPPLEIAGRVVNDLEPRARDIAMVFLNYALYPHMSVFDNMAYGLRIPGIRGADLQARVERTAAMLELTPYSGRKPRELSGGQRQRVAMGRALVRGPAAFLLDEPLSSADGTAAGTRKDPAAPLAQPGRCDSMTSVNFFAE